MKSKVTPFLCALIAGLTGVVIWQAGTIHRLRETGAELSAKGQPAPTPHLAQTPSVRRTGTASGAPPPAPDTSAKRRITVRAPKNPTDKPAEVLPPVIDLDPTPEVAIDPGPPPVLTPERRKALLAGAESFNPGPIAESTQPVTDKTILTKGQALQINYSNTWYAGEVIGFESDGGVHVRYFGWSQSWDEVVLRSDLRLDPQAREHAVDQYGAQSGAVAGF